MPAPTHRSHSSPRPHTAPLAVAVAVALAVAVVALLVGVIRPHRIVGGGAAPARGAQSQPPASTTGYFLHAPGAPPPMMLRNVPPPTIVWKPIPFGDKRKRETIAYAKLHYGISSWQITGPHVIVEHFTASTTMLSAWNAFAHDVPDPEFHSLPATCAQFIVDRAGRIYQLVPLDVLCRHTVGLNWTAIGIEMVGTSDRQIMSDAAEFRAAMRLTAWLAWRFHVAVGDVIGHNESLDSPYHREHVAASRCQTHGDWRHADMQVFRTGVRQILQAHHLPAGAPWRAHRVPGC